MGDGAITRRASIKALLTGSAAVIGAGAAAAGLARATAGGLSVARSASVQQRADRSGPPASLTGWEIGAIGVSTRGRPIERWTTRPPNPTRHVMIVSGIHGYERITYPLAEAISRAARPSDLMLSIIPSANPDGWAANSRRNARGVDLNRNFPWRWSPSDGGPRAGSEPETQALMNTILAERPDLVVWIHQPLAYVAPIVGCPTHYARRWADAAGVRVRYSLDQHGGGETWTGAIAGIPSMLVEVTSWATSASLIAAHQAGFEALMPHVEAVG